jgi:hypothetical protein
MSKNRDQFLHNLKHKKEMRKYYINYTDNNYTPQIGYGIETIDEADKLQEAKYLLSEYRLSDPSGKYKISRKPTQCWEN